MFLSAALTPVHPDLWCTYSLEVDILPCQVSRHPTNIRSESRKKTVPRGQLAKTKTIAVTLHLFSDIRNSVKLTELTDDTSMTRLLD